MVDDAAARLRYSKGAIILHWTIAVLILYNLTTGLLHDTLPKAAFQFHVSSGITILVLTVLRIIWRLTHKPPPFLPMAKWEKGLANVVHFLLYCAMLAAPLTGWAMLSAHVDKPKPAVEGAAPPPQPIGPPKPHQTLIWGVIPLPKLKPITDIGQGPDGPARLKETHEQFEDIHGTIGWIFLFLLILHIAGALKHELIDKRRQLARMGVGKAEPKHWDTAA
ncbi:MAG TPA: cytochrome b [Sphingomonas sp.]|uniref:cytochrome b n=1 Tax=Sphingomonas sp. TaxID=28214 RepID=UPI002C8C4DFC|nr:cytochrome b [Sphingomonas sp.]HMI18601.1 cytochrome b [Sphingomonas sp.]